MITVPYGKEVTFSVDNMESEEITPSTTPKTYKIKEQDVYKRQVLYYLEVRQVFLDPKLSLKKLSDMIETNQTCLSNVVNRYFGCHLKELVDVYKRQ